MKTVLQTVEVHMPKTNLPLTGFELRPVLPAIYDIEYEHIVHIKKADGSVVSWFDDGTVSEERNGITYIWHRPPTLAEAVLHKEEGGFFNFMKKSIECRMEGINYYWSAPTYDADPIDGQRVYYCQECEAEVAANAEVCSSCKDAIYRDYYRFGY
jgi:hypothetical protein